MIINIRRICDSRLYQHLFKVYNLDSVRTASQLGGGDWVREYANTPEYIAFHKRLKTSFREELINLQEMVIMDILMEFEKYESKEWDKVGDYIQRFEWLADSGLINDILIHKSITRCLDNKH